MRATVESNISHHQPPPEQGTLGSADRGAMAAPSRRGILRTTRARAFVGGLVVFLLTFLLRIANFPVAFAGGVPQFSPFDDLYHAKRIAYSAAHPLRVLSFDLNRGTNGTFCPWPPLYDMLAGTAARALGGDTAVAALVRAAWFPPTLTSLAAAVIAGGISLRFGLATGLLGGAGIALSVYYLDKSRLGAIDHHFLEFPLVLGILLAVIAVGRARDGRSALRYGGLLAVAISLALFVQPALVFAAGIALVCVLFSDSSERMPRRAAAFGFGLASSLVFVYRFVQPPGYPDNEWYLGAPHAALLLGAAAACLASDWLLPQGISRGIAALPAAAVGALTIAAVPTALAAMTGGSHFFGGDPWLRSIAEFQPLFFNATAADWLLDFGDLGGGALLAIPMLFNRRWWTGRARRVFLLFAIAYLVAAVSSNRFLTVAAPLLAVSGAVFCFDLWSSGFKRLALVCAVLLLVPGLVFSMSRVVRPPQVIRPEARPMVQAAQTLARPAAPAGGVLCGWSWGHLFNVIAGRRVLLDNFGNWSNPVEFGNSTAAVMNTRERFAADYCRNHAVRFVVLENPLPYFAARAQMAGLPREAFEQPVASGQPTRLMRSTFWWRAYFEGGRTRPDLGPSGAPFTLFRLVRVETEPRGARRNTAVQIWELLPPRLAPAGAGEARP
jgi:asparagine N-glycosylation enzyme membrane subunit Stt3